MITELVDMQLLKQLQPDLLDHNVTESVFQTSISAVTFVAIADRKTDTPAAPQYIVVVEIDCLLEARKHRAGLPG